MKPLKLQVAPDQAGLTLIAYLRIALPEYPSVKAIKRAIDGKKCKINGRVEFFSTHRVRGADEIEILLGEKKTEVLPMSTLFEDEELIVLNKPPGKTSESFESYYLVHRLDKETSGAMLFAKTAPMQKLLEDLFFKREVEKEYLAICEGDIALEMWKIDNYLEKKASYQGGSLWGATSQKRGKRAVTFFQKIKSCDTASLVLARPITGRTHQIRVHLKDKGHPVLGDWQYAKTFKCSLHPPRHLLHAHKLSFLHPKTQERVEIQAPHYKDFLEVQKNLFGA